jgi:hypothetical protein
MTAQIAVFTIPFPVWIWMVMAEFVEPLVVKRIIRGS